MAEKIGSLFSNLFFPPLCSHCHQILGNKFSPLFLCPKCSEQLELFGEEEALKTLPSGVLAAAAGPYLGILDDLIQQLKFYNNLTAAKSLGAILITQNCTRYLLTSADMVVPVPISWRRRLSRGFNQCDLILSAANRHCRKQPFFKPEYRLMGRYHRLAQHTLGRSERLINAQGAFYLKKPTRVAGKVVTVFDDVMTTMATAEAMVNCLQEAGAKEVRVVTLARTM